MQRSLPGVTEFAKFLKLWLALHCCPPARPLGLRAPRHNVRVALPRQRSAGTVVK